MGCSSSKDIPDTTEEVVKNNEINVVETKEQDGTKNQESNGENSGQENKEKPTDSKDPVKSEDIKVEITDSSNTETNKEESNTNKDNNTDGQTANQQESGNEPNAADLNSPDSEEYDDYDEPDDYDSDAPPDKDIPPMKPFNPFMNVKPAITIGQYRITKRFINRILFPVYVGQKEGDKNTWFIIKEIEKSERLTVDYFKRLSVIKCPNLVKPIEVFENDGKIIIVEEYLSLSLLDIFKHHRKYHFKPNETEILKLFYSIITSLSILNDNNYYHGNINPNTIFYSSKEKIYKLTDYSIINDIEIPTTTRYSDVYYNPPESRDSLVVNYNYKSDIFNTGMILYNFVTNKILIKDVAVMNKYIGNVNIIKNLNIDLFNLLERCLSCFPDIRPEIIDIYQNKLIQNYTDNYCAKISNPDMSSNEAFNNYINMLNTLPPSHPVFQKLSDNMNFLLFLRNTLNSTSNPSIPNIMLILLRYKNVDKLYNEYFAGHLLGHSGSTLLKSHITDITVNTLNLSGNSINNNSIDDYLEIIKYCNHLQDLNLSNNCLKSDGVHKLCSVISCLSDLKRLSLSGDIIYYNDIGNKGLTELSYNFHYITQLVSLNLSSNNIEEDEIKDAICNISSLEHLREINISYNIIGEEGMRILCNSMGNMRKLSHLNVRSNIIGDDGIASLCNIIRNLTNLLHLDIGLNNITKSGAQMLSQNFQYIPHLEYLDICNDPVSGYELGIEGSGYIANCIKNLQYLKYFNISGNGISDRGVEIISGSFKNLKRMEVLNLSENKISNIGCNKLADIIVSCPKLKEVYLGYNNIQVPGIETLAVHFCQTPDLAVLDLGGNQTLNNCLLSVGMRLLNEKAPTINNLKTLNLRYNNIGDEGMHQLCQLLVNNPHLKSLDLVSNNISTGVKHLCDIFSVLKHLEILNFGDNKIEDNIKYFNNITSLSNMKKLRLYKNGISSLSEFSSCLKYMTRLLVLDLAYNKINDDSFNTVSENLNSLFFQDLDVSFNNLKSSSLKKFAFCANRYTSLMSLKLSINSIKDEGLKDLSSVLSIFTNLHMLDMEDNGISSNGAKELASNISNLKYLDVLNLRSNLIDDVGVNELMNEIPKLKNLKTCKLNGNKASPGVVERLNKCLIMYGVNSD